MRLHPFEPDTLGTPAHLDALDALRLRGDVVEIDPFDADARRTFVVLGHAAVTEAARQPALASAWGTGAGDDPEAGCAGVPFRAAHTATGATRAAQRSALAPLARVDDALVERARATCAAALSRVGPDVDALALAIAVQRAAVGPRFGVDDAFAHGLVLRAAFAQHDDPARAGSVPRDVDDALVAHARAGLDSRVDPASVIGSVRLAIDDGALDEDSGAWLVRFAWLTAFVTTELAIVHVLEALADPAVIERLRAEPAARARFVDESLRVQSPVAHCVRVADDDITLADVTIPKGARVLLSFAAANHDPRVFERPRALDLTLDLTLELARDRIRAPAFAFGAGAQACLGAPVAVAVLRAVVDSVVAHAAALRVIERVPLRSGVHRGARACRLDVTRR